MLRPCFTSAQNVWIHVQCKGCLYFKACTIITGAACISRLAQLSQGLSVFQGLHNYHRGCLYFKACTIITGAACISRDAQLSQHSSADLIAFFSWILFTPPWSLGEEHPICFSAHTKLYCPIVPWFARQSYPAASYTRQVSIDNTIHVYSKGG